MPNWIPLLLAVWVALFGVYRIRLAWPARPSEKQPPSDLRRTGMFGRSRRAHLCFGILYVAMGSLLFAIGLGYRVPTHQLLQSCSQSSSVERARSAH